MRRPRPFLGGFLASCALTLLAARAGHAQAGPDFGTVVWTPLTCAADPLTAFDPRAEVNLVGDATFPAAYMARDATFLYFRYRVDRSPTTSAGFLGSSAWTTLIQVPSGNPFQYQYQLGLNGDGHGGDTIEVWKNDPASDLGFSPIFTDNSDSMLFTQVIDLTTPPLARAVQVTDGSQFFGTPDYFIDVAIPISVLITNGVVASATDLDRALFFPATGTSPDRHNKDYLNCTFLPATTLTVGAAVQPGTVDANTPTPISYSFTVLNGGPLAAQGLVLTGTGLTLANPTVTATSSDPSVTPTVVTPSPLTVRVPSLPPGATLTVRVDGTVTASCTDTSLTATVTAGATNAPAGSANAVLQVNATGGVEICDGLDNNCDGQIDEGGNALCDDGLFCNGAEVCAGLSGCQPGTPPTCDDGDPCTADACDETLGCTHTPLPGCTGCTLPSDCDDHDACTTDTCTAGACANTPIPSCVPCTVGDPCDDGDRCTADACTAGVCTHAPITGCPCVSGPEICGNGIDDDCDGLTDCADPDCATDPVCAPPAEICGNCIDDDGNGLIDWEDPACCAQPMPLAVDRVQLRPPPARVRGDRLRLQAVYSDVTPSLFDPTKQDTSLQLSDGGGALFCGTIPATRFRHPRRLVFTFNDRTGSIAGGLERGEFRVNRRGKLLFRASGRGDGLRAVVGGNVRVTVRVGNACARATMALRTAKNGLVFP